MAAPFGKAENATFRFLMKQNWIKKRQSVNHLYLSEASYSTKPSGSLSMHISQPCQYIFRKEWNTRQKDTQTKFYQWKTWLLTTFIKQTEKYGKRFQGILEVVQGNQK